MLWFCVGVSSSSSSSSAPYFTVEPRSAVVRPGDSVSVYCSASTTASPLPPAHHRDDVTITWTHNGAILSSQSWSSSVSGGSSRVYIRSFHASNEGLYQCIANNSVGAVISRPAALHLARQYTSNYFHFVYIT